jgi:NAD(P)H dehydrogenase (quinone)
MQALIVHAHPEPQSFCSALAARARLVLEEGGHQVTVSDLYAMGFNPVSSRANFKTVKDPNYLKLQAEERHAAATGGFAPDLQAEMDKVSRADLLLFTFPLWWFSVPAILKGWVDRVFAMGFAYGGGRIYERGVFAGRRAMLVLTTGSPESGFGPEGWHGDLNRCLYHVQHGMLAFCGFAVLPPFVAWAAAHVEDGVRRRYLEQLEARLRSLDTATPIAF